MIPISKPFLPPNEECMAKFPSTYSIVLLIQHGELVRELGCKYKFIWDLSLSLF
jgi:hypothetical protein